MRLLKPFGLSLVAAFALAAALSASAFGLELPENLPASTTRTWTGKSVGGYVFHAQGTPDVECGGASTEGTEATSKPPKGEFHTKLELCQTVVSGTTIACNGLGDAKGIILILGTWALVFDRLIGKAFENLTTAIMYQNQAVHFLCGALTLLETLANGETLCLHLNPTVNTSTHELHCTGEISGGVPKSNEEWGKDVGGVFTGGKIPVLLVSVNHATAVPALRLWLSTVLYSENVFADQ